MTENPSRGPSSAGPAAGPFESVSIVLPVVNETAALRETIAVVRRRAGGALRELLIVVCDRTTPAAALVAAEARREFGGLIRIHRQTLPFVGGAVREAFELARGSHVILMASDLETDPELVGGLIAEAQRHPEAIVTASRWLKPGGFRGYGRIKLLCNWTFQHAFSALYGVRLSDLTYAYRIFPTALVQAIRWEGLRHPFLLETLLKPLRLGVPVIEIPAVWKARTEGVSQNTFVRNFSYVPMAVRIRFASARRLLRGPGA